MSRRYLPTEINGVPLADIAREHGMGYNVLYHRLITKHQTLDKAVNTPVRNINVAGRSHRFDVGLDTLLEERRQGETFTLEEIALVCGVSKECIRLTERKGLHHVFEALQKSMGMTWKQFQAWYLEQT